MPEEVLSPQEAQAVADALFSIEWQDSENGFLKCPGEHHHTKRNGARDCRLQLAGGKPPTIHCLHHSCIGEIEVANHALRSALGKAEFAKKKEGKLWVPEHGWRPPTPSPREEPPQYDEEKLRGFAGAVSSEIDVAWLANRSPIDPSTASQDDFLRALYYPDRGEKVLIFQNEHSQGEFVWPGDALPDRGKLGVWFLAQPVSGEYLPNPRSVPPGQPSRRIMECVRDWRYLLLESDEAPARLWLAAVVQLPLRIAAIYTSGSRSVHVLVRVDAPTKDAWDAEKAALLRGMVTLGACRGSLSSVRLTRLPGCLRFGKMVEEKDAEGNPVLKSDGRAKMVYRKFDKPGLQKLLYLAPEPGAREIVSLVQCRDVLRSIRERAVDIARGVGKISAEDLTAFACRADHFSPVSEECEKYAAEAREIVASRRSK